MSAPHQCKFCGSASWIEPSDQSAPPDYCHPEDHGSPEADAMTNKPDFKAMASDLAPDQEVLGTLCDFSEIRKATAAALQSAYEAGVAAERERCAGIAKAQREEDERRHARIVGERVHQEWRYHGQGPSAGRFDSGADMTETPEQRRERLAIALWELDCQIERRKAEYHGLGLAVAWAEAWCPEGCGLSTQKRYRRQADAIIASDATQGWQPIESAPRDGCVLVWCPERLNIYTAISWNGQWEHFGGRGGWMTETPTHFMPLPAPPKV